MPTDFEIRARLPIDEHGHPMQVGIADSTQQVNLTTTAWQEIQVPEGVSIAFLEAVADGAATTIAWMYGGSRAGAPTTGNTVPTGRIVTAHCAGAPFIYAKAVGAACDLQIQWVRKDI